MAKRKDISREEILANAEALMAVLGTCGFSFRDLAAELGISSATLHHYFPTKGDLCIAVVQRHREAWNRRLSALAAEIEDWPRRWRTLAAKFASKSRYGHLLAVLSTDFANLTPPCQNEVQLLHSNLTGWLARFVTEAKKRDELPQSADAETMAHALLSMLQGSLLLARLGNTSVITGAFRQTDAWVT